MYDEAMKALIDQGYTVEVRNPLAVAFNNRYKVYKKTSAGDKVAIVDKDGKLVGVQG